MFTWRDQIEFVIFQNELIWINFGNKSMWIESNCKLDGTVGVKSIDWQRLSCSSVVTVTATGTATAVFICHRTSTAIEVEIGASGGVAGQCITFITTKRLRFQKKFARKLHLGFAHHQCSYIAVCSRQPIVWLFPLPGCLVGHTCLGL